VYNYSVNYIITKNFNILIISNNNHPIAVMVKDIEMVHKLVKIDKIPTALVPNRLPPNDGGIALGQIIGTI